MPEQTAMERIEALTQVYASERDTLAGFVQELQDEIDRITRRATPQLKARVRRVAEAHDRLQAEIRDNPELWSGKRRTVVVAGVKVGMAKGKGRLTFDDPDQVVKLIRRHFPEQAEALIRTKEEPIRKALGNLTVSELKRIGCDIEDTDDQVVVKPTDGAVDKLVDALLRDAERIESEASAA
jgi:hypothetical protein